MRFSHALRGLCTARQVPYKLAQRQQTWGQAVAEFANKVVVVTGGSRGIGKSIAMSFAREGAQTVLAASSQANLDAAAAAIGNSGPKPLTFAGDLKTLTACEALHAFVQDKLGRADVLINNAGATRS